MSKLARPTGKELLAAVGRTGFQVIRVRGSHHFVRHANGRCTVIPVHSGETVGPGLLAKILQDCDLTPEQLAELL